VSLPAPNRSDKTPVPGSISRDSSNERHRPTWSDIAALLPQTSNGRPNSLSRILWPKADNPVAGTSRPAQFQHQPDRPETERDVGKSRRYQNVTSRRTATTHNQEPPGRTGSPGETRRSKVASKDAIDSQTDWRSCSFGLFLRIATNAKPAVGRHFDTTKPRFQISWSPICVDLQNVDRTSRNHWPPRVLESPTETERKGGSRPPPNRATALPGLPRVRLTRECGVSGRECGLVYCLKLDRGEFPEAALPTLAVVGALDPRHDRQPQFLPRRPPLPIEDILLQQGEERFHGRIISTCPDPSH
jgi:hypothetical protein